jgi:hypothetical protein
LFIEILAERFISGFIGDFHILAGSLDDNGLEVFRSHDGAKTGPARRMMAVIENNGIFDQILRGWPDDQGAVVLAVFKL